jgi:Domain of unknown function (DUF397)
MRRPDFSTVRWRKSTVSGDGGCLQVTYAEGMIGLRDSKDGNSGPILAFSEREWSAFLAGARSGEFDLDQLAP